MELLAERNPEEARQLLDPVLERRMAAVHRYEGMVNQIMGEGIMALFGAPLAHEDHTRRACYAALAMQAALRHSSDEVRCTHGLAVHFRIGLNAGEVVVRAISEGPYDVPVGRLVTINDPDGNIVGLEDRSKGGLAGVGV
jgi:class 3 adenylate cyclase